tara:strand:+ start:635 stop:829 length:195 start_codon:yes stop_codon:yes gene_type:complete
MIMTIQKHHTQDERDEIIFINARLTVINSYKNPHLDTDTRWLNEYEEEINKLKKRKEEIINRKV